ncbi:MAG: CvpA family protein [Pseudomonadota bacterium]
MPIADIVIAVAIVVSVLIGFLRGFLKEALSLAALFLAVWAALNLGDDVGGLSSSWLSSSELQIWFGRVLVFVVIVTLGGLLSWGAGKLARLSMLSGTDRVLGMLFGFCRGLVLVGVFVLGGQYANADQSEWWNRSAFIPYAEFVADWLREMAPRGMEIMQPEGDVDLPLDLRWRVPE